MKPPADISRPLISVVIPTFNRARCVGDAIESVLAQTCRDYEVIVVNDGSTDDTSEVLAKFGDRIGVVRQENQGVSEARNTGIRAARGEWVAFLDSDDVWTPNRLQTNVAGITKHPEAVGHLVDASIVGYQGGEFTLFTVRDCLKEFERAGFRAEPLLDVLDVQFFTSTWMLKRSAIEAAGLFRRDFRIYEDLELLSRVALEGPFVVSTASCVRMRRMADDAVSLSNLHLTRKRQSLENLCQIYETLLGKKNLRAREGQVLRRRLSGSLRELSLALKAEGKNDAARGLLWRSVKTCPGPRSALRAAITFFGGEQIVHAVTRLKGGGTDGFRRSEADARSRG